MKIQKTFIIGMLSLLAISLAAPGWAAPPKMKMITQQPEMKMTNTVDHLQLTRQSSSGDFLQGFDRCRRKKRPQASEIEN